METITRSELNKVVKEIRNEQRKKFKIFVVFVVALCLILCGMTGVASYTLAAGQVSYTAKDTNWTVGNTQDAIDELYSSVGSALVGSIYSYMGNHSPFGYLACDGTEYNISDYPRLADHFKSEFGSSNYFGGDGETTFAVPDLRGEFLRGTGNNSHSNQGNGESVGNHQDGTYIPLAIGKIAGSNGNTPFIMAPYETATNYDSSAGVRVFHSASGVAGNDPTTTYSSKVIPRPTNTSVLYIIKY